MLRKFKKFAPWLAWIFLIASYALIKQKVDDIVHDRKSDDPRILPSPKIAKFISFGFQTAMADIFWIEGINYFGDQFSKKDRNYRYMKEYCDLILRLDPLFRVFYDWAATVFIYNGLVIDRNAVIQSTRYANEGIKNFHAVGRYDDRTILKGAFNYALEVREFVAAIPYFEMAGRSFRNNRDMLLVGASYANYAGLNEKASDLRLEFLGHVAFESQTKEELKYALNVVSSSKFNARSAEFISTMRLRLEQDEDIKKLVKQRLELLSPLSKKSFNDNEILIYDKKLENILKVNAERTWLPPEMHILLSL